jgi:hypothetical protein
VLYTLKNSSNEMSSKSPPPVKWLSVSQGDNTPKIGGLKANMQVFGLIQTSGLHSASRYRNTEVRMLCRHFNTVP